jgi:hypothetical protein
LTVVTHTADRAKHFSLDNGGRIKVITEEWQSPQYFAESSVKRGALKCNIAWSANGSRQSERSQSVNIYFCEPNMLELQSKMRGIEGSEL